MRKIIFVIIFFLTSACFAQNFSNSLIIPPVLLGTNLTLSFAPSTRQFFTGHTTSTYGINGSFLGPTLILNQGDSVKIAVENNLPDTTTCHWHGLHVPAVYDGSTHNAIPPGDVWNVNFKILNKAATYWYHPHLHMNTEEQVMMGLAGMIIIKDTIEAKLNLPRTYGVDDFPVILQDKKYDTLYQFTTIHPFGDSMLVNGTVNPFLDCPRQVVRLRLLNASAARVYNLGFSDNRNFHVIASDASLLSQPYQTNLLVLANGERAEILVDLKNDIIGSNIVLMSYGSLLPTDVPGGAMGGMIGGNGPLEAADFGILQLNVKAQTVLPVTTIPASLITQTPWSQASANKVRRKEISGIGSVGNLGEFFINDTSFNMEVFNDTVLLNDIEVWNFVNKSNIAHPIHLHDVSFYILERNGSPPPVYEQGLKDVFLIRRDDSLKIIAKFEDFANDSIPYMYHCHNLHHEDMGMMLQFLVINNPASVNEIDVDAHVTIYPNPNNGAAYFESDFAETKNIAVSVLNIYGEEVKVAFYRNINGSKNRIDFSDLPGGIYFVKFSAENVIEVKKVIVVK